MKRLVVVGAIIAAVALAWHLSPIGPEELMRRAQSLRDLPGSMIWAPAAYVVLGLVMFPFVALRLGTILIFGPLVGAAYAIVGCLLAALVGHALGRLVRTETVMQTVGPRAEKLRQLFARRGILSVAAARMVPTGPFMVVNAFAGAIRIPRRDFLLGTLIGTSPGLIVLIAGSATLQGLLA